MGYDYRKDIGRTGYAKVSGKDTAGTQEDGADKQITQRNLQGAAQGGSSARGSTATRQVSDKAHPRWGAGNSDTTDDTWEEEEGDEAQAEGGGYDTEEEEGVSGSGAGSQEEDATEETGPPELSPEVQAFLQSKINELTRRERRRTEKLLKGVFGTTNLDAIREYADAGRLVAEKSGKSPAEIKRRLIEMQGTGQQTTVALSDDVREEMRQIRELLASQRELEVREKEEAKAKKTYGSLYDLHRDDIEDVAEEKGLTLTEAAAIVLQPHLKTFLEKQLQTKQQVRKKRQIDTSTGGAARRDSDPATVLTEEQKRAARKMGIPLDRYLKQLKNLGRV